MAHTETQLNETVTDGYTWDQLMNFEKWAQTQPDLEVVHQRTDPTDLGEIALVGVSGLKYVA